MCHFRSNSKGNLLVLMVLSKSYPRKIAKQMLEEVLLVFDSTYSKEDILKMQKPYAFMSFGNPVPVLP